MRHIFTLIILLFALNACEKSIELELNDQSNQLAMYAFVYPDSTLKLHLSKSQNILSVQNYKQVEKGRFRMYINDVFQGNYIFPSDTTWGEWEAFSFDNDDTFKIEAYELEGDTISVESQLSSLIPITGIDTTTIEKNDSEKGLIQYFQTKVSFSDPKQQTNYYQIYVERESWGEVSGKRFHNYKAITYDKDDPVFTQTDQSGSLLQGLDFQGLYDDRLLDGTDKVAINIPRENLHFDYYEDKIKLTIYLYHHTYDYYEYLRTRVLSAGYDGFYDGLPIFEPVQVHNNITGGLGLVSGMSFDSRSITFTK